MADQSDVMNLLAAKAAAVAYPNGTGVPSITGAIVKVYPGWPVPNKLQADINAGGVHISIYPLPTEKKINSTLGRPYQVTTTGAPTLFATVSGQTVTLSGAVSTPTNVYFLIDNVGYHYSVQSNDTLTTIATAMAIQIPGATSVGAVVTIPDGISIVARTGGVGTASRELRRQAKDFQITIWSPTPALRDKVASALDIALSEESNISLSDGAPSYMVYTRSFQSDASENYLVYRRDFVYTVNYATTQTIDAAQVVAPVMHITDISNNPIKTILE